MHSNNKKNNLRREKGTNIQIKDTMGITCIEQYVGDEIIRVYCISLLYRTNVECCALAMSPI